MATTEILAFAIDGGANVISQADYAAASFLTDGYSAGILPSARLNKTLRQSSFLAAGLAQAVADLTATDVDDDGDLPALVVLIKGAISAGAGLTLANMNTAIGVGGAPLIGKASTSGGSGYASFRVPHGAAPTTNITNGDLWSTTGGLFFRLSGATVQLMTTADVVTYTASGGITLSTADFRLSNMAQSTVKGRAAGAGTGAPSDLSPADLCFMLGLTGKIFASGANAIHSATELKCDGAAVSRSTYANLFSVIGTTWGVGNGSTTFNVPDLRGLFLRGFDDGAGVDSGRVFAALQADGVGPLTLTMPWATSPGSANDTTPSGGIMTDSVTAATITWAPTATNTVSETRPKNQTALYVIKI